MKIFTFIFAFLMLGFVAIAQEDAILITDFEGEGLEGFETNNWSSEYSPQEVENPLMAGINSSATVVYYPAHSFQDTYYPEWGTFGGFFCGRHLDPTIWADYNYLTFKFLIQQDTIVTGDGIAIKMKYETSESQTHGDLTDEFPVFEATYTQGAEDIWEEVFIEIPEAVKAADYKDFCVITQNVSEDDNDLPMYFDHFRFTLYDDPSPDDETGIEKLVSQNGFSVYMLENMMNIRMDEECYVNDVQVFDIKGSMMNHRVVKSTEQNFSMPVDLKSGVYMLRVRTENETLTRKFVKL